METWKKRIVETQGIRRILETQGCRKILKKDESGHPGVKGTLARDFSH
jgi:hypothetical protein